MHALTELIKSDMGPALGITQRQEPLLLLYPQQKPYKTL